MFITLGHEYKTVIICAYEPLEADGSSTDSTKTLVQPGIFNTVVSRSKQQVIVVGNPFRLLDLEKRMNTNPKCWNEYIKLCLENDTMLYSDDIEKQSKIDRLLRAKVGINDRLPPQRSLSAVQHKTSSTPPFVRAMSETPSSQMVKSKSKKKTSVGGISDVISQEQKQTIATISDTVHQDRKLKQTKATEQTESKHKKNAISLEKSSTKKSKSLEQSVEAKSLEKRRKQSIEQASGIKDIKTGQYPPLPMNTATACVHVVTKQTMYTEYRKPVLPDDTVSTTSKHQKKKKQKKPSTKIHIPFYHSHSEPPLEVAPETMANKSANPVMPGVSFADILKGIA